MLCVLIAEFFEERAILLGHLGRHEQALAIYVHVLRDQNLALQLVSFSSSRAYPIIWGRLNGYIIFI